MSRIPRLKFTNPRAFAVIAVVGSLFIGGAIWSSRHEYFTAAHSFRAHQLQYEDEVTRILSQPRHSTSGSKFELPGTDRSLSDDGRAQVNKLRDGTLTVWFRLPHEREYYVETPRPFAPDEFKIPCTDSEGEACTRDFDFYYEPLCRGWYLVQDNRT